MKTINKKKFKVCFIAVIVCFCMLFPITAFASLGDYEIQDLYQSITDNIRETNKLLKKAFEFSQVSPYDVVNGISGTTQGNIAVSIINASKTMSLTVATLLLMVDFFKKSINFEWSSKWENVLIFLIKIIVIKQIVQNADVIIGYIYSGFQYINNVAVNTSENFLPCDNKIIYNISVPYRGDTLFDWCASHLWHVDIPYTYNISQDAVKIFYPDALFPTSGSYMIDDYIFSIPVDRPSFTPIIESIFLQPYFIIMKAIAIVVFVIVIGRVFELSVYTIFAPLPLATFASDTTHDVAKSFIKNYIATVLQISVIVVMFIVYVAINNYFTANGFINVKLIQLVELIALGLGVIKSGAWSKKICGIG
ncbi:MAG: hypothetical protein K2I06_06900 [Ruminococcus sp.]|nr:hypothetical protein [Ruminococcus sp.]